MNQPVIPRLVVGSWSAGSGVGCIMNLKSWEKQLDNKEPEINDRPAGFNDVVRSMLVTLNDFMCTDKKSIRTLQGYLAEALCPECTMQLIDLANAFDGSDLLWPRLPLQARHRISNLLQEAAFNIQFNHSQKTYVAMVFLAAQIYRQEIEALNIKPRLDQELMMNRAVVAMNGGVSELVPVASVKKFWHFIKSDFKHSVKIYDYESSLEHSKI